MDLGLMDQLAFGFLKYTFPYFDSKLYRGPDPGFAET